MKILSFAAFLIFMLQGCAAKQIPKFDGNIFVLDNDAMLLRYKWDKFTLPVKDRNARGAVVFLPEDFQKFIETYFGQCKEWDEGIGFINSNKLLETNGIRK